MKRFLLLIGLAVTLALLIGCAAVDDPANDAPDNPPQQNTVPEDPADSVPALQTFSLPYYQQVTLDPITCPDGAHQAIGALLYDGLYVLDRQFAPQPALAESCTYDRETFVYTIRLRSGAVFSDGSPLTAQDAAASLLRARNSSRYGGRLAEVISVTPGEGVVYVALSRPNSSFTARLDIPIVKAGTENSAVPIGAGRYLWQEDEEGACLVPNPYSWRRQELPISRIPLVPCKDADAAAYAFLSREIQLIAYDVTGTGAIRVSGRSTYTDAPTSIMQYVGFNTDSPVFSDAALRAAAARGIDRNACVNACLLGHGAAASLPISPASALYPADAEIACSSEAYEAALADAGYAGGTERTVTMLVSAENAFRVQAAQRIAEDLSRGDLQITVRVLPWVEFREALAAGDYDLYYGECKLTADWDLSPLLAPDGALNFSRYTDEALPDLLDRAARAGTAAIRAVALRDLYNWLGREAPFTPVCFKNISVLLPDKAVDAIQPTAADPFYDLADWTIHWAESTPS